MKTYERYLSPEYRRALADATYYGVCVVHGRESWTRIGPAWFHPQAGWIVVGPGVYAWGTSRGLAELATETTARPEWHAVGASILPDPVIVLAVLDHVLASERFAPVRAMLEEVKP